MPTVSFCDSFDHYSTADLAKKWTAANTTIAGGGRTGSAMSVAGAAQSASLTLPAVTQTIYVEGAYKFQAYPSSEYAFLILKDGTGNTHIDLRFTTVGDLRITRNGTQFAVTSGLALAPGTWYHIGLYAKIDDAAGEYDVRVSGVSVLAATAQDTRNAGVASVGIVQLISSNTGTGSFTVDDFVISTDGFCGDCTVKALFPQGAGNYSQWTPSAGLGWQCVDEASMNSDTDYVSSNTTGQRNSYDFTSITAGVIKAVQQVTAHRKDDAGSRTVKQFARIGGTDYDGSAVSVLDSYVMQRRVMSVNPATGTAWTGAQVDAAEFGTVLIS